MPGFQSTGRSAVATVVVGGLAIGVMAATAGRTVFVPVLGQGMPRDVQQHQHQRVSMGEVEVNSAAAAWQHPGADLVIGSAAAALAVAFAAGRARRQVGTTRRQAPRTVARAVSDYGEDLAVSDDAFVALGLAHCFEQVEGKLVDTWVLEPVTGSSVEVVNNGALTSYETLIGTTVGKLLAQDISQYPSELLAGHEDKWQWGSNLQYRTGCAARTWMRDHARDVIRKMVPDGELKTGFNTSTENKRILNFVHEVKDSDNVKQDMSIDVYGREGESKDDTNASIEELYNV